MNIDIKPVKKKKYAFIRRMALIGAIGLVLFFIQNIPGSFLTVNGVTPNMVLPLAVAFAFFFGETAGGFFGFFSGILLDLYISPNFPVNALLILVMGCACGLIARLLLTKNIASAIILCIVCLFVYYGVCWICFRGGFSDTGIWYLKNRFLLSVIYSWIFIIPWYFLCKKLSKGL